MGTRFESRRRRTLGRCMCRMVTELQNVSSFPEGGESIPRESRNICFHPRANSASNSAGFPPITSSPTRSPTLHLVDVRLTSTTRLINITYLLTYLLTSVWQSQPPQTTASTRRSFAYVAPTSLRFTSSQHHRRSQDFRTRF